MNGWLAKLFKCDQLSTCMCLCVYVYEHMGGSFPSTFLLEDISTQPISSSRAKYHSRSLFLPHVEKSEDRGKKHIASVPMS